MSLLMMLGNSSGVIETLTYGRQVPESAATTAASNTSWFPYRPCHQNGTLVEVEAYFAVTGAYKLKVLRQVGLTWDEVHSSSHTATSGLNTLTAANFGTVNLQVGDVVGFYNSTTGRMAYTSSVGGCIYLSKSGETASTGNTMTPSGTTSLDWQFNYKVEGVVSANPNLINEDFRDGAIPWDWIHAGTAWTYGAGGATNGATLTAHSLNSRRLIGNLSTWTWITEFTFDTSGARMLMFTRNTTQTTFGSAFEVNQTTNNLVVYQNYSNNGSLTAESTNATGLTLVTGRVYRMTMSKSFRTMTYSITDTTDGSSYSITKNQEDSGTALAVGLGYGAPSLAAMAGTVTVSLTKFTVPTARPDILCIGDSITEGSGLSGTTLAYHRLLAAQSGKTLQTSSQGGASTLHFPGRLAWEQALMCPKNIIILIGTNDTVVADWKTKMKVAVKNNDGESNVIVCSVPAEAADSNPEVEFNPYIISEGWGNTRIDLALSTDGTGANRIAALYFDTLHPNADGHVEMKNRIVSDDVLV